MTNSVILYRVPFHIFELNELLYQSQGCSACQSMDKTIVPKGHNDKVRFLVKGHNDTRSYCW